MRMLAFDGEVLLHHRRVNRLRGDTHARIVTCTDRQGKSDLVISRLLLGREPPICVGFFLFVTTGQALGVFWQLMNPLLYDDGGLGMTVSRGRH